jgi:PTS system mannose-specific IIB component
MSISLVRVDDRLIHGQTVIMWTKVYEGDGTIVLIPDKMAEDKFMLQVIKNACNCLGEKAYVFSLSEAITKMPQAIASKKKYHIISKTIQELYELRKKGIDFGDSLIFGTASQKPDSYKIANNIYLEENDREACDYLSEQGVKIVFKLIPAEAGMTWDRAREKMK